MNSKISWIMLLPLLACTKTAAQDSDNPTLEDLKTMSLEELLEVKITVASQVEETSHKAPSSVTVFTQKELLRMGVTSVEELLNFVPGFLATREIVIGDGYRIAARGQTTPQDSYNILFMINGQRLNSDLGGGAFENNRSLTLANVEQVEVIRGPGSALYGTSAFSGVVNLITSTKKNNALVSGGNLNRREAYFNVSKQENNWKGSLFARYSRDEGESYSNFIDSQNSTPGLSSSRDPKENQDVYLTLAWKDQLQMNFRHTHWDVGEFGGWLTVKGGQDSGSLSYQLVNTEDANLVLEASYLKSELMGDSELMSAETVQSLPPTVITNGQEQLVGRKVFAEQEWELSLSGHYRLVSHHQVYAGFSLRQPEIEKFREQYNYDISQFNFTPPSGTLSYFGGAMLETPPIGQEGHRNILGLYLQDQYHFNESLTMTLGIRYDHYSDFGGTTNPRIALIYQANADTTFKLMYGEAFRAPSIRQFSAKQLGNPNLKPEKINTIELAWSQRYSMAQTTLTYFQNQAQNRIDTALVGKSGRKYVNLDDLTTRGWELETLANFTQEISLRTAYTYLQKTETNPRRFPQQTFSIIANYQTGSWNLNLNAYYHDKMEQQIIKMGTLVLDDYWVMNGAVRYSLYKGITLVGRVSNLLNEEFYSSTKITMFTGGIPNRGRTYSIGIESIF